MVKVLVVDDELDFCNSLKEILAREGYEVIIANSGLEAINKVNTERPQLILLDIQMPQMDGIQTLKKIREIDKEAVITMITVVKDISVARSAIKLGAINYILKPLDADSLKSSLQGWATQMQAKQLGEVDILALKYNEEKFKAALNVLKEKGYNIKCIEDKSMEIDTKDFFDLLILRADIMGDNALQALSRYKEGHPGFSVIITVNPESAPELINKIAKYGRCQYFPVSLDTYGLILIIHKMVSASRERLARYP